MIAHEVTIKHGDVNNYHVHIDGTEINGVRSATADYEAGCLPTVSLELQPSRTELDALAKLNVALDIDDVRDAIFCLQLEMRLDKSFREAVIASATSALIEHDISQESVTEIATSVVERIFDGEII